MTGMTKLIAVRSIIMWRSIIATRRINKWRSIILKYGQISHKFNKITSLIQDVCRRFSQT